MAVDSEALKKQAAQAACDLIEDGMVVGLGSGTTASHAINALAERVGKGLNIMAIPTSESSRLLAEQHSIKLTTFAQHPKIDITIDGADQVEARSLNLIKGLGNALLREKIVARASKKLVIMVDERKMVDCLGNQTPLPVEIIPFGWEVTQQAISRYCLATRLKLDSNSKPLLTDCGHYLLQCDIPKISDAAKLDKDLKLITGVVETGLFIQMASLVIVAKQDGIVLLQSAQLH